MADDYDTPDPRNDQELIDGLTPIEHEEARREARASSKLSVSGPSAIARRVRQIGE